MLRSLFYWQIKYGQTNMDKYTPNMYSSSTLNELTESGTIYYLSFLSP